MTDQRTFEIGNRVRCNGYIGTVTRLPEWSDTGYEVRLPGGTVHTFEGCISAASQSDIDAANKDPHFQWEVSRND
ncbi:hypothetical protein JQX09_17825 [Sulfitobacter pseudonitzschiae]|uniref:Uncharacterized protein n=1 Tax=Pseudosulfitobacter pseudonitzschiae TaxID=1402135 RepID=A0A9Q2NKL2_9RHOB|nr:hypothetical protein [Pseudosulfitobacter pseudonitzschiae]MBM2293790.1 hypothetical protein [Pseudosulfitobacter pseudonitzschiae]MBM2298708.1 hypothetical protein [Pseudosulfitobacter pseudonitzschiae]MBM2303622.1 hypothetical protein [Pseudosulfitobacter pseudonitzschiae]MBM2313405.1 hypothetical protein [Pseudosulfitobacter pseudonitzschiae]MBM2318318.1 hypothetical protein [Pseudosulfitobacter pseudonitzschiae]